MSERNRKSWEKTRAKGFNRFVVRATLLFGFFMPIFHIVSEYIFDGKINAKAVGWRIIGYSIVGLLCGWWSYEWNEYKYRKTGGQED